ncbi:MAG: hypothetical protein A2Z29_07390 [Chloroflexi bacterium RBG_16_56_11]|nr:MAG: hypothetical protein A2Z29_07390 [Chloroflexi bacterium RBG_16_56_11]
MYNAEYTRTFYNAYGEFEWTRLESPYGRLQAIIHEDCIKRYIKPGDRVLDAGSGPGRFSITVVRLGANVTVLDISDGQLKLAKEKIAATGLIEKIDRFIEADICDLSAFPGGYFDMVICFGGALSYVCEKRQKVAYELMRVTRPGGTILVSVMSRFGGILYLARQPGLAALEESRGSDQGSAVIWSALDTGDLPGFPSRRTNTMHLFTAEELPTLFKDCQTLEIAGSNVTIPEILPKVEVIASNPSAWSTLVELERRLNHDPGLVNSGSHIILTVKK